MLQTNAKALLPLLNDIFGIQLTLIEDIEAVFNNPEKYPDSYREVMSIEEEMMGTMYSKCIFSDQAGKLVGLNLYDCNVSSEQIEKLKAQGIHTKDIKSLNLGKTQLRRFHLSEEFASVVCLALNECPELQRLGLHPACKQLARLDAFESNIANISFPDTYHNLYYVDLSANKQLTDCEFHGGLTELQVLLLRDTAIQQFVLPGDFPELVHLHLNHNEQLAQIEIASHLPKLSTLQLRKCACTNFSEECITLGMEAIKNEQFWETFTTFFPKLDAVFFGENPVKDATLSTKLVDEKRQNNLQTIRKYYEQRAKGLHKDNENKVLLIGNGKAGKTSILKRLTDKEFEKEWDSTHGITIQKYMLKNKYSLYFWDFGGQDIYHNTHRLFMQQDAVYILAWRLETESEERTVHPIKLKNGGKIERSYRNYPLSYWLDYAKQLGKGSPIIIAQTNRDEDEDKIDSSRTFIQGLEERYTSYFDKGFFTCFVESDPDLDRYNSYRELEKALITSIENINENQREIAEPLFELREYIRNLQANKTPKKLSLDEYTKVAKELGVIHPIEELETWLFRTGVVYFKRGVFDDQIILDQEWVIDAIYALFDRTNPLLDEIRLLGGKFTGANLHAVWSPRYPKGVHELLLGFMIDCDICYEVETQERYSSFEARTFVAPKLLSDQTHPFWEQRKEEELVHDATQAQYWKFTYDFLHEKVIEGIIARTAYLADMPWLLWQSGTRIREGNEILYVERRQNELFISSNGKGSALLLRMQQLMEELQEESPTIAYSEDGYSYKALSKDARSSGRFLSSMVAGTESASDFSYRGEKELIQGAETIEKQPFKKNAPQPQVDAPLNEIEQLISEGRLEEAARMMLYNADLAKKNDLIALIRRISDMNDDRNRDILSYQEYNRERSKATYALLALLRDTPLEELLPEEISEVSVDKPEMERPPIVDQTSIVDNTSDGISYIQILSASPEDKSRMRTGQEYSELRASFRQGRWRDNFKFKDKEEAVDLALLQRALRNEPLPNIVHFSGHGGREGIYLMNRNKQAIPLSDKNLVELFSRVRGTTQLVILNACYSSRQAKLLSELDMYVLGTQNLVDDRAAVTFSKAFYESYIDGASIQHAFQDAKMIVGQDFPEQDHIFEAWYKGKCQDW